MATDKSWCHTICRHILPPIFISKLKMYLIYIMFYLKITECYGKLNYKNQGGLL
jgi:hypothetical protein